MKRSHVIAALILTLGIGFFAGRLSDAASHEKDGNSADERTGNGRTRASERPNGERSSGNPPRLRDEIRKAPPEALSALVYRALELSDPLERRQLLLEIFSRMDAGNFEAMIRESERSSLESSRNNYDEWAVMLVRAGQVGGQAAMEVWITDPKRNWDQLAKTMQGWASADPDAARRWIEQQDLPPTSRSNMIGAMMAGAIAKEGVRALDRLASLSEEDRLTSVQWTTQFLTQNAGKDGLMEWAKSVNATNPGSPYADRVTNSVVDKMVWAGANQYQISTVVADLERMSSVLPLTDTHLARAIAQTASRDGVRGLELLDRISRSSVLADKSTSPMLLSAASDAAIKKDRPGVEKWLAENPGSPIHGKVTEALNRAPVPQPEAQAR